MSTLLHVLSFPFWFVGLAVLFSAITNRITLKFGMGYQRKATTVERMCASIASLIILAAAYFMTIQ